MARLLLPFALVLLGINLGRGQLVLSIPSTTVQPGAEFASGVAVNNFTDVAAISFAVRWDPGVLQFQDYSDFNLPTQNVGLHFGTDSVGMGLLTFVWLHPQVENYSLPNGSELFRLNFKAIGTGSSPVNFDSTATLKINASRVVNNLPVDLTVQTNNGTVQIEPMATTDAPKVQNFLSIWPNPSASGFHIGLTGSCAGCVWRVTGWQGRQLRQGRIPNATDMRHALYLDRGVFPGPGIYLFSVYSPAGVRTAKLWLKD